MLESAAGELFDQGLGDPRGGDYRAVSIRCGNVWGGSAVVTTRAWVVPDGALAWNGLVYPTESVGERADLAADVDSMVTLDERARAAYAADRPGDDFYRHRRAVDETAS